MRNTRTVAACVAATTLFGLLSASPALASELDRGDAAIIQGQESSGSGLGLLGRSATDAPAARSDRGDAGMLGSQQSGGPDAPLPARPLPEAPTESGPAAAPSPGFSASLEADRRLIVSLPMETFSSGKRFVISVDGTYVGETSAEGQVGGVHLLSTEGPDGVARFRIDAGRNGGRVEVRRYFGRLGWDTEPREETVFDQQVAVSPDITATLVDGRAVVSVPEKFLASNQRLVVLIDRNDRAEFQGDTAFGVARQWKEGTDRLFEISDVQPGAHLEVWEYGGKVLDGLRLGTEKGQLLDLTL
jgi:hypothetical protein